MYALGLNGIDEHYASTNRYMRMSLLVSVRCNRLTRVFNLYLTYYRFRQTL